MTALEHYIIGNPYCWAGLHGREFEPLMNEWVLVAQKDPSMLLQIVSSHISFEGFDVPYVLSYAGQN